MLVTLYILSAFSLLRPKKSYQLLTASLIYQMSFKWILWAVIFWITLLVEVFKCCLKPEKYMKNVQRKKNFMAWIVLFGNTQFMSALWQRSQQSASWKIDPCHIREKKNIKVEEMNGDGWVWKLATQWTTLIKSNTLLVILMIMTSFDMY